VAEDERLETVEEDTSAYEPPTLVTLGSVAELTRVVSNSATT
jgi:hypothetical protein